MKKLVCIFFAGISLFFLPGASVWEGAAEFSPELPDNGFFMATNSFPLNSVVDVTNLENGKIARLIVSSRLDSSGFLALLSKDAAESLGIQDRTLSRIRMSQNDDPLILSKFQLDYRTISSASTPDYDYSLVPSEPRPPEKTSGIDLSLVFEPAKIEPAKVEPVRQPESAPTAALTMPA